MFILTAFLTVLLGVAFLFAGYAKVRHAEPVTTTLDDLGVGRGLQKVIGALEILGGLGVVVGLWLEPLSILAAIGLVLMMVGAILWHVKAKDSLKNTAGALLLLAFSGVVLTLQAVAL